MGGEGTKYFGGWLLNLLKDPDIGVIKHTGYGGGIGRWSIAKHAANMAMESHLFDVLIWLKLSKEEQRPGNLQKTIAEHLGIEFSTVKNGLEDYVNEGIARAIHDKLKNERFLLVLGDLSDSIDLTLAGVPNTLKTGWMKMRTASVSKVVYVTTSTGKDFDIRYDREFSFEHSRSYTLRFQNMVREEAIEAAHSLKRSTGSSLTNDTVLDFLMYLFFTDTMVEKRIFGRNDVRKRLLRYSMAQGFVTNSTPIAGNGQRRGGMIKDNTTEEEVVLLEKVMKPLFEELHDRCFIDENGLTSELELTLKTFDERWLKDESLSAEGGYRNDELRAIAITKDSLIYVKRLHPSPGWHNITALFITYISAHPDEIDVPPTFFDDMQCLRVLELHSVPITSLPSSLSSLANLRLLSLEGCEKLTAFPTSLQCLERLEFLQFSNCTSLRTMPEQIFKQMSNLRHLDLSLCRSLVGIPERSFENMQRLEVLDLSNSSSLKSLPSSLSNLVNLKQLHLRSCSSLKTVLGVLKNLSSLEVLDLSDCCALEDIQDLSFGGLVPNIKSVDLSYLKTTKRLSFKGCQRLVNLRLVDQENLEVLSLSGATQLEYLYFLMSNSNITHPLRYLEMLPINYKDTQDPPFQGLNWSTQNDVGALVWVTEPNFFKNISEQVFDAKCFSQFRIRISSSIEEKPNIPIPMGSIQSNHFRSIYRQINSYFQTRRFWYFRRTYDQHLETYKCEAPLENLYGILHRAELLTLFDNSSVDFIGNGPHRLKECRIGSCQNIRAFYKPTRSFDDSTFGSLEVIWVSDLPRLTAMDMEMDQDPYNCNLRFPFLKHVHLERCPKLVTVFTSSRDLNNLKTLEIKFCSRLEYIFHDWIPAETSLQRLESLCLWELPKLKRVCKGYLPKLQKIRVRGCRKLTKLPLRVCNSYEVEIEGESDWWNHLEWDNYEVDATKHSVRFQPWRLQPFTLRTRRH